VSSDKNAATADTDGKNSEVGYCRPPQQHQFKKGQSGNPNGRPRKSAAKGDDLRAIVREELLRPVTVMEGGKKKTMPLIQVLIRKDLSGAVNGSRPVSKLVCDFMRWLMQSGPNSELSTEESIQSILDYRPILNILPGTNVPENPIL
jgi:hypothetical protein